MILIFKVTLWSEEYVPGCVYMNNVLQTTLPGKNPYCYVTYNELHLLI